MGSMRNNNTAKGNTMIDIDRVIEAISSDEYMGFCVKCGEEAYGVEPDARKYKCEECGELAVYGAEELLITYV